MNLTKNITLGEVKCRCNKCEMGPEVLENLKEVAKVVQCLRDWFARPVIINSGYRCETHNKAVGGAKYSQHRLGKALDFNVKGIEPKLVRELCEDLLEKGEIKFGGLGAYTKFVHIDIRNYKARW